MQDTATTPPNDTLRSLLDGRLILVTGKGGTGKTTYAAVLAILSAARGKRTLLLEMDNQRPSLTPIFGREPVYTPANVLPRLDICNLTWEQALQDFIGSLVPSRRVVGLALQNKMVTRFLDFVPGSQEIVTLSALGHHVKPTDGAPAYDVIVADMPASGHAFSLLDITRSALGLFRSGPVRTRATELRAMLREASTKVALVALPEEMVVNETIETAERLRKYDLLSSPPAVFVNRATLPTLSDDERKLLERLGQAELDPLQREFVRAGTWEDELEQGTSESAVRLREALEVEPVLVPPGPPGGDLKETVKAVAVHLGRQVGVGRRDLPWT
ncbi:MAG: AAA family ATPase [Alphaproteobacteria bacterium]|nr:AAA family ATPase [Alphaproteobacteria bacterium]MCB9698134.1 AAA family ATPase [Alphaproteobacteria bacterium]